MTTEIAIVLLLAGFLALLVSVLGLIFSVSILRRRVRRLENAFGSALDEEWRQDPHGGRGRFQIE